MESAVIIFHKNALTYCKHDWIIKCLDSIQDQTYQDFDVFEVAYGDNKDERSILKYFNKLQDKNIHFFKNPSKDHSYAMNFLLDKVFKENDYKYCFNINIDDYYHTSRFSVEIQLIKRFNYDLVSSNMYYIDEDNNVMPNINLKLGYKFVSTKKIPIQEQLKKEQDFIVNEFNRDHNIIAHPCVCYTKRFWNLVGPYKHVVPKEDLEIFKRAALDKRINIHITRKKLLYYRIHNNQIGTDERIEKLKKEGRVTAKEKEIGELTDMFNLIYGLKK